MRKSFPEPRSTKIYVCLTAPPIERIQRIVWQKEAILVRYRNCLLINAAIEVNPRHSKAHPSLAPALCAAAKNSQPVPHGISATFHFSAGELWLDSLCEFVALTCLGISKDTSLTTCSASQPQHNSGGWPTADTPALGTDLQCQCARFHLRRRV